MSSQGYDFLFFFRWAFSKNAVPIGPRFLLLKNFSIAKMRPNLFFPGGVETFWSSYVFG